MSDLLSNLVNRLRDEVFLRPFRKNIKESFMQKVPEDLQEKLSFRDMDTLGNVAIIVFDDAVASLVKMTRGAKKEEEEE